MSTAQLRAINDALYEVSVITEIMRSLAKGAISGGPQLDGTEIEWLTNRLQEAEGKVTKEVNRPGSSQ
jgi:hypothetical protein